MDLALYHSLCAQNIYAVVAGIQFSCFICCLAEKSVQQSKLILLDLSYKVSLVTVSMYQFISTVLLDLSLCLSLFLLEIQKALLYPMSTYMDTNTDTDTPT